MGKVTHYIQDALYHKLKHMTNRKFNVVPVKTTIVTADKIILIDSEDSNKLKQADATAFK